MYICKVIKVLNLRKQIERLTRNFKFKKKILQTLLQKCKIALKILDIKRHRYRRKTPVCHL